MLIFEIYIFYIIFLNLLFFNKQQVGAWLIGLGFFAMIFLKHPLYGADAAAYYNGFQFISKLDYNNLKDVISLNPFTTARIPYDFESGYVVVCWVFSYIGLGFTGFIFCYSAFVVFSLVQFCKEFSDYPILAVSMISLSEFFLYSLGIYRQTIAISICLLAYKDYFNKRYFLCFIKIFISLYFHKVGFLLIPLFFVRSFKIDRSILLKAIVLLPLFGLLMSFGTGFFIENFMRYSHKYYQQIEYEFNFLILLHYLYIIGIYKFTTYEDLQKSDCNNSVKILLVGLVVHFSVLGFSVLARGLQIYFLFAPILISNYIYRKLDKSKVFITSFLILIACAFFLMYQLSKDSVLVPFVFANYFNV